MAKRKKSTEDIDSIIEAPITDCPITETVEKNYMPYAMSVIISRAIPEIDGFKPSHRKILYTMLKMGLMTGQRTKSTNVVGQTMHLNPHGDDPIYQTLVRLTRGNESLLYPFIDSKGSFGKQYSSEMKFAASRYTEVKLDPFCSEIFSGIDKNAVDFVPNYDNTTVEPVLLPTTFPNILVSPNMGIAVGIMSKICSFNLGEVCDGTIQILRNPNTDVDQILDIIKAPDFPSGGSIIYNRQQLADIYRSGEGSFLIRSKYVYDEKNNCIEIVQIPYSTSIEEIMKKIGDLVKNGNLKEIVDFRDEIDLSGFKLTLDLRKGVDPDKLMNKLFKQTTLQNSFACMFYVLIDGVPKQLGLIEIIKEWIKFRINCYKRELLFDINKKSERLHLLQGLGKILLDIDKAIRIIRHTPSESDVIPNLMEGFQIDEVQAEFIADIRLRNLNREYILKRTDEINSLTEEISELQGIVDSEARLKTAIAKQLKEIKQKYSKPRVSDLLYEEDIVEYVEEEEDNSYPVRYVYSKEGYVKKLNINNTTKAPDEHKLKESDEITYEEIAPSNADVIVFTNKGNCYKTSADSIEISKANQLGEFLPAKLGFEKGETPVFIKAFKPDEYNGSFVFIFENGKGVKISASEYQTKSNRRKLTSAYSTQSPIAGIIYIDNSAEVFIISDQNKAIQISTDIIPIKNTRTAQGVTLFTLKKGQKIIKVLKDFKPTGGKSYRKLKIPAVGIPFGTTDGGEQINLL